MDDQTSLWSTEFKEEHRRRLLLRGRSGRPVTIDDVVAVMPNVELTPDVVASISNFLAQNDVLFDEQIIPPAELEGQPKTVKRRRRRTDPERLAAAALAQASTSSDPIRIYLQEIGKVPLLSAEEEIALARRIEAGALAADATSERLKGRTGGWKMLSFDEKRKYRKVVADGQRARRELTAANLRLVVSIAKRYSSRGVSILDLVQEGNIGLMRAVEKYDHTKGFKFSTYATWWIRQAITRALSEQSRTIRIPSHVADSISALLRSQRRLSQQLEREPTVVELAEDLGLPEGKVEDILRFSSQNPLSLDSPLGDSDDSSMADFVVDKGEAPVDQAARKFLAVAIHDVLDELSDREAQIVRLRFGLVGGRPRTLEEVGQEFGVTRERIRQIESKTLAKLRHPLRSDQLRDYLD